MEFLGDSSFTCALRAGCGGSVAVHIYGSPQSLRTYRLRVHFGERGGNSGPSYLITTESNTIRGLFIKNLISGGKYFKRNSQQDNPIRVKTILLGGKGIQLALKTIGLGKVNLITSRR